MAFDSSRGQTVMYGGTIIEETWEFAGSAWTQRSPAHTAGLATGGMVYDATRARILLFGTGGSSTFSGTAEYDGNDWVQVATPVAPPVRVGAALAFDSARGVTVMFGGGIDSPRQMLDDTWEYGANGWAQRAPLASPPGRWFHSIAFDAARGRTVLFAGTADQTRLNDTWEYDGTTWVQVPVANAPSTRFAHSIVSDSARGRVVLFGGWDGAANLSETWEYDGINWTQNATANAPSPRSDHQLVYDDVRARTVLFGGFTSTGMTADTWEYDGTNWAQIAPRSPGQRFATTMSYDAVRERSVLFGGVIGSSSFPTAVVDDTWEYGIHGWQSRAFAVQPAARGYAMSTYDHQRQRTILFGGVDLAQMFGDTWEYDGTAWTQATPPNTPPARNGGMMTFDLGRRRVVLFGGATPAMTGDTWEYDGVDWHQIQTTNAPSARYLGGMAYDTALGRSVLFGGWAAPTMFGDTWEYDGVDWTQRLVSGPTPRRQFAMIYDPIVGNVMLHGGRDTNGIHRDTWSYDGTSWQQLAAAAEPPGRVLASMTYDLGRTRAVLFGGNDPRTWELLPAAAPTWTRHGPGCAGTGTAPSIDAASASLPALGSTFTLQLTSLPGPTFLLFGFDLVQWGGLPLPVDFDAARPQCNLWVGPLAGAGTLLLPTTGAANHSFAIPAHPSFAGLRIGTQALALDGSVPAGFALTNGGILRVH